MSLPMTEVRMKGIVASIVVCLTLVTAVAANADPIRSSNTLALTEHCSNGRTYTFLVSPASGHAVLDTSGTTVQVTFALAVSDPLNELGGSFVVPLTAGIPQGKLISCTGSVLGTEAVVFTSVVLLTPQRRT
jgi:hypothetical protein